MAELSRHSVYLVTREIECQKWHSCNACGLSGARSRLSRNLVGMTSPYEDDEPLLPEQTRDDDPRSWGESGSDSDDDERILREVPPHHQ